MEPLLLTIMCMAATAQADYSLFRNEKPSVQVNAPINDYGPIEFKITVRAAIIEFYDGAKGHTKESIGTLQGFANSDRTVERVKVVNEASKLAEYYGVKKLPTFIALYDRKEVDRIDGIPAEGQLEELYQRALRKAVFTEAVLNGQLIYFGADSFFPNKESKDVFFALRRAGCDTRGAYYNNHAHREWYDYYDVEEYPVFVLTDSTNKELERAVGADDGLDLIGRALEVCRPPVKIGPVLLDFGAGYCPACVKMEPTIKKLESKGYTVRRINTDKDKTTTRRFGITKLPTFIILHSNGTEYKRSAGLTAESTLEKWLQEAK